MKAIKDLLQRIRTDRKNRQGTWIGIDESHIILNALAKSERIEAENAELRARLDKAVELPCKENQEIYYINEKGKIVLRYARTFKIMFELGIEVEATNWERGENGMLVLKTNLIHANEFGDKAFLTKEAAEERLKELQEKGE